MVQKYKTIRALIIYAIIIQIMSSGLFLTYARKTYLQPSTVTRVRLDNPDLFDESNATGALEFYNLTGIQFYDIDTPTSEEIIKETYPNWEYCIFRINTNSASEPLHWFIGDKVLEFLGDDGLSLFYSSFEFADEDALICAGNLIMGNPYTPPATRALKVALSVCLTISLCLLFFLPNKSSKPETNNNNDVDEFLKEIIK